MPKQRHLCAKPLALLAFVFVATSAHAQTATQKWAATFTPGYRYASSKGVAVDPAGDVFYLTTRFTSGPSDPVPDQQQFLLVKYAGSDGHLLWEKTFSGTNPDDYPTAEALAVDSAGNVAVTGTIKGPTGTATDRDICTIKYAGGNGDLLWERRYNNSTTNGFEDPEDVVMNQAGDVIIVGGSFNTGTSEDILTICYASSNGQTKWERRVNSLIGNGPDRGFAVAVDSAGSVVVTGDRGGEVYVGKYDGGDGHVLWERSANGRRGRRLAIDASGNVAVAGVRNGPGGSDFYAGRFNGATGSVIWELSFDVELGFDTGDAVATDAVGDVFVTGQVGASPTIDYYTAKYAAADGQLRWEKRFNGAANRRDAPRGMTLDLQGNPVVTGDSLQANSSDDLVTVSYSSADGSLLWEQRFPGSAFQTNRPIALAPDGGIVVANGSHTIKYAVAGAGALRFLAPANNAVIDEGSPVALTVEADSTVTSVAFYDNGSLVTRKTGAPFDTTLPGLSAGVHFLTAIAETPGGGTNTRAQVRVVVNPAGGTTYTFSGAGSWNTAGNWTPTGVPGANDSAIVSSSVVIPADLTLRALALEGSAVFTGPGNLTVTENLTFLSGTMRDVALTIPMAGRFVLLSDATKTFEGVALRNEGTMILAGAGSISGDAATTIQNFGLFTFAFQSDTTTGQYETQATVGTFINNGTVDVDGGSLQTVGEYVQEEGETNLGCARLGAQIEKLYGRIEAVNVAIESGTMRGSGRIQGNLVTRLKAARRAFLRMGCSPGTIEVTGDLTLTDNATVVVEVDGSRAGEYGELKVAGQATLDGELIVTTAGFTPSQSDTFDFLTYGSVAGTFDTVSSNAQITFGANGAQVNVTGPNPPAPKALNIATRMKVETGDNALIAGFIITGAQPKKVIIRGIGPSLPFGGVLANPTLNLDNVAVTNDNWRSNQEQEIIATTIPPTNNLESAIVATLSPGPHTAILRGNGNATGIGVVEVYDLDGASPVQLANISSRGFVQSGDNVMIGGFIIGGTYPAKMVVRAIGPSLPFPGILANPTLELVDQNGGRISNDNWRATQEAEIIATTIPPTNDKEAAIVATLVPGAYTAIVRGVDDTTGIAVVEAYNLQ